MRIRPVLMATVAASALATAALAVPSAMAEPTQPADVTPQIIGGHDATETYGFMASMQSKDGQHNCGATLVAPQWLVTAGHCATEQDDSPHDPSQWQYRIGSNDRTTGGETVDVAEFIPHPDWSWTGAGPGDIALVKLAAPVQATPAKVAAESPAAGADIRQMGWGLTCPTRGCGEAPVTLQEIDNKVVEDSECSGGYDPASELCTGNGGGEISSCYGDSGGPAVVRNGEAWELVGATSRGQTSNCPEAPGIYTDVTAYGDWIAEQTGGAVAVAGARH